MKRMFFCFAVLAIPVSVFAQPATEIYLFDLKLRNNEVVINNPRNITQRSGYDNQPFFHPDKPLLYFVSANGEGRTDIIEYNYKTNKSKKITNTHEREYSPTVTPDKKFLSCIVQRDSGEQDLVKYPIAGGAPVILIDQLVVGYHAWASDDQVLVFTLPPPFKLRVVNVQSKKDSVLAEKIGRSLHPVPGEEAVSFLQQVSDEVWQIKKFDAKSGQIGILDGSLKKEHFIAWTSDGAMIMTDDRKLFFRDPKSTEGWKEVQIKSGVLPGSASRIAVNSKDTVLALVVNE